MAAYLFGRFKVEDVMIYISYVIAGNTPNAPAPEIYHEGIQRFVATYNKFPPEYPHRLMLIDSNGGFTEKVARYFDSLDYDILAYRANGWDIGAHQFAAFNMEPQDWIMCFSSWAHFRQRGWLKAFVEARDAFGDGLFGSTTSFERNAHVRGTGFFVRCERIHRYPFGCNSREESFEFESGPNSLTLWCRKQGYGVWLVTPSGTVPLERSRDVNNIFRRGDQSNIWTFDKHTDIYDNADQLNKNFLAHVSDFNSYLDLKKLNDSNNTSNTIQTQEEPIQSALKLSFSNQKWHPSDNFLTRIQSAYNLLMKTYRPSESLIWGYIAPQKHKDLHDCITGIGDGLRDNLTYPIRNNLYFGVDLLNADFSKNDVDAGSTAISLESEFYTLAVALGSCVMFNPEGGSAFPHRDPPSKPDRETILSTLPFRPAFPNPFEGEFGLASSSGIISYQAIQAVCHAHKFVQAGSLVGAQNYLEISGGMGRVAYYSQALGIQHYTIIDLPMAIVGQAIFLGAVLGEDRVSLPGEKDEPAPGVIRLRDQAWLFSRSEEFDAVLNVNAMTEFARPDAQAYADWISKVASVFLSINHEANNFTVQQLFSHVAVTRSPHLLRPGYVEELYFPKKLGM